LAVELVGLYGVILTFLLMLLRIPISIAMAIPAVLGILYLRDWNVVFTGLESIVWAHSYSYTLSTIPMFILMGELLFISGITSELFTTFRAWFGKLKGGLAMATIGSSALFSAASGSSIATVGTMGVISTNEMMKAGYNKTLIGGSIVAGGSLGNLIPPSTMFIIYGMMTEQSIGQLLMAGTLPGILLTVLFMISIYFAVLIKPELAPGSATATWKDRFVSLRLTGWIVILFVVVIGGMYIGLFSPTEAAGVGAFFSFAIALVRRKLTWSNFVEALSRTLKTTGFLFPIVLSSFLLNYFLAITKIPIVLAGMIDDTGLPRWAIFFLIVLVYIILGSLMDAMAMVVITLPIVMPILQALNFDLIWFGVIIVIVVEMALISPPVGLTCFVLNGISPQMSLNQIFKGAMWFMIPICVLIVILYIFPEIALFLPSMMQ
jgi:C4-dicarboxylate transporter, DctM subunit